MCSTVCHMITLLSRQPKQMGFYILGNWGFIPPQQPGKFIRMSTVTVAYDSQILFFHALSTRVCCQSDQNVQAISYFVFDMDDNTLAKVEDVLSTQINMQQSILTMILWIFMFSYVLWLIADTRMQLFLFQHSTWSLHVNSILTEPCTHSDTEHMPINLVCRFYKT